jgi:hypothetical protein
MNITRRTVTPYRVPKPAQSPKFGGQKNEDEVRLLELLADAARVCRQAKRKDPLNSELTHVGDRLDKEFTSRVMVRLREKRLQQGLPTSQEE